MPLPPDGRWHDLAPRIAVGLVIAGLGIASVWLGGAPFAAAVVLVCAAMLWELLRMIGAATLALPIAAAGAAALALAVPLPGAYVVPVLMLPAMLGVTRLSGHKLLFLLMVSLILLAGYGLIVMRAELGPAWVLWLALVVIATDVAGYFAGRLIGGPKFWPTVSPKKTWAGTLAGWVAAAAVGAAFAVAMPAHAQVVGVSVAVSMAAQIGDIAESALKRRLGVKDSSNLLPGHGGVFDRFDGMLGASVLYLLVAAVIDFPPVAA